MNRTLKELLAIAAEAKAVYAGYQTAAKDGHISVEEGLQLASDVIAIMVTHNVTMEELKDLLGELKPYAPLLAK